MPSSKNGSMKNNEVRSNNETRELNTAKNPWMIIFFYKKVFFNIYYQLRNKKVNTYHNISSTYTLCKKIYSGVYRTETTQNTYNNKDKLTRE